MRRTYHWHCDTTVDGHGVVDTMLDAEKALELASGLTLRECIKTVSHSGGKTSFYRDSKQTLWGRRVGAYVGCIDREVDSDWAAYVREEDPDWDVYVAALAVAAKIEEKACASAKEAYEAAKKAALKVYQDAWAVRYAAGEDDE